MSAIRPIPLPCTAVEEWLSRHTATKCPTGYALGLSAMEKATGILATTQTWVQRTQNQIGNEVRAAKQKRLRSAKISRT